MNQYAQPDIDNTLDQMVGPGNRQIKHQENLFEEIFAGGSIDPKPRFSANLDELRPQNLELVQIADQQSVGNGNSELKSPNFMKKL